MAKISLYVMLRKTCCEVQLGRSRWAVNVEEYEDGTKGYDTTCMRGRDTPEDEQKAKQIVIDYEGE